VPTIEWSFSSLLSHFKAHYIRLFSTLKGGVGGKSQS